MSDEPVRPLAFDTDLGRPGTVWVRSSAGEVLPGQASPLSWTLVGTAFDTANRRVLVDQFGLLAPDEVEGQRFVGRWQGHFYLNMSLLMLAASRGLGAGDPAGLQRQAGLVVPIAFDSSGASFSLARRARSVARIGRTSTFLPLRRFLDRRAIRRASSRVTPQSDRVESDAELATRLLDARRLFERVIETHHLARFMASGSVAQLDEAVRKAGGDDEAALRWTSGNPLLESLQPSLVLRRIATAIGKDEGLRTCLMGAKDVAELAAACRSVDPAVAGWLDTFVVRFGSRGLAEFDPLAATWDVDTTGLVQMLRLLVDAPQPSAGKAGSLPPVGGPLTRLRLRAMRSGVLRLIALSERTKADSLRVVHMMRPILRALQTSWSEQMAAEDFPMLSLEELVARAHGTPEPTGVLTRRAAELKASSVAPPITVVTGQSASAPSDTPAELAGIGASPGVARGRAVVALSPLDDLEVGDILVTTTTDTAWTPVFLVAGAVVTELGGLVSHASIVARELGVPAVVGVPGATTSIATGDVIEVNGSTGSVAVVKRASA